MHLYTSKSLLITLERAVEQLAGCLTKQGKNQQLRSKYNSMQCRREGLKCIMNINKRRNRFKPGELSLSPITLQPQRLNHKYFNDTWHTDGSGYCTVKFE